MVLIFFASSCIPMSDNTEDVENTFEWLSEKFIQYFDILTTIIAGERLRSFLKLFNIDVNAVDAASLKELDSQENSQSAEVTK